MKLKRFLTVDEVAELFAISVSTAYRLAESGAIPSLKIGGSLRFDPRALQMWLAEQTQGSMTEEPATEGPGES